MNLINLLVLALLVAITGILIWKVSQFFKDWEDKVDRQGSDIKILKTIKKI